jgi:hypothetical protein
MSVMVRDPRRRFGLEQQEGRDVHRAEMSPGRQYIRGRRR